MNKKKLIREQFRQAVFERDGYKCRYCGLSVSQAFPSGLDAHHITDRHLMPNGGYVAENGISLCFVCHMKAEQYHKTGEAEFGFAPNDLYDLIGSSLEKALQASSKLR